MPCSKRCYSTEACEHDEKSRLPAQSIPKSNPYSRSMDHVYPKSVALKCRHREYRTDESRNVTLRESYGLQVEYTADQKK